MSTRSRLAILLLLPLMLGVSAEERPDRAPIDDEFLGKNVTLVFHLENSEQQFSVSTAKRSYRLHFKGETVEEQHEGKPSEENVPLDHRETHFQERHGVAFQGEVSLDNDLNRVMVTCVGQFYFASRESTRRGTKVSEHVEEIEFEIDASALVTPGAPEPLVRSGEHVLTVTVTVED